MTLNPLFLAQARYRRRDYDGCIELCSQLLEQNSFDQVRAIYCSPIPITSYSEQSFDV